MRCRLLLSAIVAFLPCLAWDAPGHRAITMAALRALPPEAPAFLRDEATMRAIADQSVVPDRWRSSRVVQLPHDANPDHYIDAEDLEPYGMTLRTLPVLRYEYVKGMVLAKERAGASFKGRPVNPATDPTRTQEYAGFLPYSIAENYAKLQSSFRTIRVLEKINDPARADQLAAARADAVTHMGILSHFVGDAAQPLHTTRHHHGWIGENPEGYTTDRGFHAYIDGGVLRLHRLGEPDIARVLNSKAVTVEADDPWPAILDHIQRSFEGVEPLYALEKSGELKQAAGRDFIAERLADGARMLRALYWTAWASAEADERSVRDFLRYDGR